MIIEQWLLIANVIIALANIIFIIFYYLQLRETKKPVLSTKFIGAEKDNGSRQEILEHLPQYLYLDNLSNNKIKNLIVKGAFSFGKNKFNILRKIDYINPYERVQVLIRFGDIIDKYPDLFEEKKDKRSDTLTYLKIPKETLQIKFNLNFKWGLFNRQKDVYEIEWLSLKSCPELKYHPRIACWNKRNDCYIQKLEVSK